MLGLDKHKVALFDHQIEWETNARETIEKLKPIFGTIAIDIQHVGSTAIKPIKAKPIIDIAVGVTGFDDLADVVPKLEACGIYKSKQNTIPDNLLYVIGDTDDVIRTHHIHIVVYGSTQWHNYINLCDYLNACPEKAATYEKIKVELAQEYPDDREAYSNGKDEFIIQCLVEANEFAARQK